MIGSLVDQAAHGFISGQQSGESDHGDDEQSSQVFGAAVAVGVATGGFAAGQGERNPQRHGGEGVGEVVDGVGQQRHRAGEDDNQQLRDGGDTQGNHADLDGADTGVVGLQGVVDGVGGVVAVRSEDGQEKAFHPAGVIVVVVAAKSAAVSVTVLVAIVGAVARVRVARLVRVGVLVRVRVVASCGRVRAVDARRGDVLLRGGRCVMGVAVEAFSGVLMRFVGGAHEPVDSVVVR